MPIISQPNLRARTEAEALRDRILYGRPAINGVRVPTQAAHVKSIDQQARGVTEYEVEIELVVASTAAAEHHEITEMLQGILTGTSRFRYTGPSHWAGRMGRMDAELQATEVRTHPHPFHESLVFHLSARGIGMPSVVTDWAQSP